MKEQSKALVFQGEKYGSGMLRQFGMFYLLSGMGFLLRRLRMDDRSAENIRKASRRGHLVYVLYVRSKMDWLALNRTLNKRKLPLSGFTPGLRCFWHRPIKDLVRQVWGGIKQFFTKTSDRDFIVSSLANNKP